jgi:hypothetical protein
MDNANDMSLIFKVLIQDSTLKTLMSIDSSLHDDYSTLLDNYFLQTYISDKFTNTPICRLLIRYGLPMSTNNNYVKWNYIRIESYVPVCIDIMENFESRTLKISDRIGSLLESNSINDRNLKVSQPYELISNSNWFKRYVTVLEYKKVYC